MKILAKKIVKGIKEIKNVNYIIKSTVEVTKKKYLYSNRIIAGSPVYFGSITSKLKFV